MDKQTIELPAPTYGIGASVKLFNGPQAIVTAIGWDGKHWSYQLSTWDDTRQDVHRHIVTEVEIMLSDFHK